MLRQKVNNTLYYIITETIDVNEFKKKKIIYN